MNMLSFDKTISCGAHYFKDKLNYLLDWTYIIVFGLHSQYSLWIFSIPDCIILKPWQRLTGCIAMHLDIWVCALPFAYLKRWNICLQKSLQQLSFCMLRPHTRPRTSGSVKVWGFFSLPFEVALSTVSHQWGSRGDLFVQHFVTWSNEYHLFCCFFFL